MSVNKQINRQLSIKFETAQAKRIELQQMGRLEDSASESERERERERKSERLVS